MFTPGCGRTQAPRRSSLPRRRGRRRWRRRPRPRAPRQGLTLRQRRPWRRRRARRARRLWRRRRWRRRRWGRSASARRRRGGGMRVPRRPRRTGRRRRRRTADDARRRGAGEGRCCGGAREGVPVPARRRAVRASCRRLGSILGRTMWSDPRREGWWGEGADPHPLGTSGTGRLWGSVKKVKTRASVVRRKVYGHLARKRPPPRGPPQGPTRHSHTVGSWEEAVSYERGTPIP
ncbi:hypothetical protein T484DRAFT_2323140 [Baffinella frigidus]|nr:hypothetical protein T484DRAFT_2323140 [Cryptophyta sp. CCMP2293]